MISNIQEIISLLENHKAVVSHSLGVCMLAWLLTEILPSGYLTPSEEKALFLASLLHDCGKGYWEKEWFLLPRHLLSNADWSYMSSHAPVGAVQVTNQGIISPAVTQIIAEHHERPGGKGYPKKIQTLSKPALILAACDVFMACIEPRPYRSHALSIKDAFDEPGYVPFSKTGAVSNSVRLLF